MLPRSCGMQINGQHFGGTMKETQTKGPDGKIITNKEFIGDIVDVSQKDFIFAITNQRAVSDCDYDCVLDTLGSKIVIVHKDEIKRRKA